MRVSTYSRQAIGKGHVRPPTATKPEWGLSRKDGLITPRDLLRWAERGGSSKSDVAMEGYMLLAERLRTDEEKEIVRSVIEEQLKVSVDCETLYYDTESKASQQLREIANSSKGMHEGLSLHLSHQQGQCYDS